VSRGVRWGPPCHTRSTQQAMPASRAPRLAGPSHPTSHPLTRPPARSPTHPPAPPPTHHVCEDNRPVGQLILCPELSQAQA
jgi:hypothetical protein